MSESTAHAALVCAMLDAIKIQHGNSRLAICADVPRTGEYPAPFAIGGFCPDVYVNIVGDAAVTIGEAKTARDIDTLHTRAQLKEFFEHLCTIPSGTLWMSVPWARSGEAQRVARAVRRETRTDKVKIVISGWLLGSRTFETRWHD